MRGFTLLEVIVGLVVAAIAVTVVSVTILLVSAQQGRLRSQARLTAADSNARFELALIGMNVRFDLAAGAPFETNPAGFELLAWCESRLGTLEECTRSVRFEQAGGANRLLVVENIFSTGHSERRILGRTDDRAAGFTYLTDPAGGGQWTSDWTRPDLPPAFGIVVGRDTTLIRLGPGA